MRRIPLLPILCLCCLPLLTAFAQTPEDWATDYEKSDGITTPDYNATIAYLQRLAEASPWIRLTSFGVSPQGRDLPLVILSRDGFFTPEEARASKKPVVLIQAGIHAGEIDGKDAGLMLLRDIAVTKTCERYADKAIILFMPIFNVDGHERRGAYNRINQDGPAITGWRVTANNLNLNRDYMKADAPEMRAWLAVYSAWMPDLLIDCHVTDGIDFQYNLTYTMEMYANMNTPVVRWQRKLLEQVNKRMAALGDPICPYVFPREDKDLSQGMLNYAAPPRFSTGYAAIRNRPALLIETHSLKPYKTRVTSTYHMLGEVLTYINVRAADLRKAVDASDLETLELMRGKKKPAVVPLRFEATAVQHPATFLGWKSEQKESPVSGGTYTVYNHDEPDTMTVPFLDDVQPTVSVTAPRAYIVPQELGALVEIMRLHGLRIERLATDQDVITETYVLSDPKWRERPYEGRHTLDKVSHTTRLDTLTWPAGTYVVRTAQTAGKAAVHLLEPDGPDSFLSWGFLDAIFEQKEYFEPYVMEGIAPKMLAGNHRLREEFETRIQSDSAFAASPRARLQWIYDRSPWKDSHMNVYPIGRCLSDAKLASVPESDYRRAVRIPAAEVKQ